MTLPTSCGPATTVVEAAHNDPQQASFTPTGCAAVPFAPTLTATVDRRGPKGARGNPALHTSITLPAGQASIRTATVALPSRLTLDLPAIKAVCTSDQAAADACPSGSIVGTVSAITPLLATGLSGPVNMVQIPGSLFPGLRLSLNGPTPLRLTGTLGLTKGIAASFDGLPDVPLSNFDLTFVGGGPLKLFGPACGKALKFTAQLTGHNGATVTRTATATIPNCPATAAAALSKGTRPRLRLKLDHGRDAKPLSRAVVTLPKGLTARKGAGRVALVGDGKRAAAARAVKIARHRLALTLPAVAHATLTLGTGTLRGRPHGRFAVRMVRTDGKAFTARPKATRLR